MPPFRRQTNEPLFPNVLWNRPIARQNGGRLLIIGGHRADFSLPTNLYQLARAAGIGQATVVLPDVLRPLLAGAPDIVFVPSSPSGSLGRAALAEIINLVDDHDAVLLAGLSNNSETTILAEGVVQAEPRKLIVAGDAVGLLEHQLPTITQMAGALIVADWPQLLKLTRPLRVTVQLTRSDLAGKLAIVQAIAATGASSYAVSGPELTLASEGELIVAEPAWSQDAPETLYALAAAFWTQSPSQGMAALATAAYVLQQAGEQFESQPSTAQWAEAIRRVYDRF